MSRLAVSFLSTVGTGIFGLVMARTSMEEWLLAAYEASPFNTVLSFIVAAAFGACASWALNEWRLGRTPLGKRLDAERDKNKELRRQLAAASGGRTPDERDAEIEDLQRRLSSLQHAHSFYLRQDYQEGYRSKEARKRARSKFSKLTHDEAELVYGLFKGRQVLATSENAMVVASAYRAGAIENLNNQHKEPSPGCFVRVRDEWTRMLNEHENDFREIHGL